MFFLKTGNDTGWSSSSVNSRTLACRNLYKGPSSENKYLIRTRNIHWWHYCLKFQWQFNYLYSKLKISVIYVNNCANKFALNLHKMNIVKFITNNAPQYQLSIIYNKEYIGDSVNRKFIFYKLVTTLTGKIILCKCLLSHIKVCSVVK